MTPQLIKIFLPIIISAVGPPPENGKALLVRWEAASGPVAGYRAYWGMRPGIYLRFSDAGPALSNNIYILSDGKYYIAATAYNGQGVEGPYSNEVAIEVKGTGVRRANWFVRLLGKVKRIIVK
jgi:hypothetical protein